MRGWFGIGAEGVSKPANTAALLRTAHAFGAAFAFTVAADYARQEHKGVDTSDAPAHMPFYAFPDAAALIVPEGCRLVGIELLDDAAELPSFRHPPAAAYVLGRERGALSPDLLGRCDHVVRIPMRFCVNLAVAGAIVMYDRLISLGRFAERPLLPGAAAVAEQPEHVFGGQIFRSAERMARFAAEPPPPAERDVSPRRRRR